MLLLHSFCSYNGIERGFDNVICYCNEEKDEIIVVADTEEKQLPEIHYKVKVDKVGRILLKKDLYLPLGLKIGGRVLTTFDVEKNCLVVRKVS